MRRYEQAEAFNKTLPTSIDFSHAVASSFGSKGWTFMLCLACKQRATFEVFRRHGEGISECLSKNMR